MSSKYYKMNLEDTTYKLRSTRGAIEAMQHSELVESDIILNSPETDDVVNILQVCNGLGMFYCKVKYEDFVYIKGYIYKTIIYTTTKKESLNKLNEFKKYNIKNEDEVFTDDNIYNNLFSNNRDKGLFRGENDNYDDENIDHVDDEENDNTKDNDCLDLNERSDEDDLVGSIDKDYEYKSYANKINKKYKSHKRYKKLDILKSEQFEYEAIDGLVRHTTVCIPFESYIYIQGIRENDEIECELEFIKNSSGKCLIIDDERVVGVKEADIVRINVDIVKTCRR